MLRFNFQNQVLANQLMLASSKTTLTISNAFLYTIKGDLFYKTSGDLPELTGTIADDYQRVYAFSIDNTGAYTVTAGNSVPITRNISSSDLPVIPSDNTTVGILWIKNESNGTFTGGTTTLDESGVTYAHSANLLFGI